MKASVNRSKTQDRKNNFSKRQSTGTESSFIAKQRVDGHQCNEMISSGEVGEQLKVAERTSAEIDTQLSKGEQSLNSQICAEKPALPSTEVTELKAVTEELRAVQTNLQKQLAEIRKYITSSKESQRTSTLTQVEPQEEVATVLTGLGSRLPSLRHVMMKQTLPDDQFDELSLTKHVSDPDHILARAGSILATASRRRANLEYNLATLEQSQQEHSVFHLVQMMSKGRTYAEKARISAMINDAIASATKTTKSTDQRVSRGSIDRHTAASRLSRAKSSSASSRPTVPTVNDAGRLNSSTGEMVANLMLSGIPFGSDMHFAPTCWSRSPSPDPQSPWRLNRRRSKRPLYPRLVNDPILSRTAVLPLGENTLKKSGAPSIASAHSLDLPPALSPTRRSNTTKGKTVRFEEVHSSVDLPLKSREAINLTTTNKQYFTCFIPIGQCQFSASLPASTASASVYTGPLKVSRSIQVDTATHSPGGDDPMEQASADLLFERGTGIGFAGRVQAVRRIPNEEDALLHGYDGFQRDIALSQLVLGPGNHLNEWDPEQIYPGNNQSVREMVESALLERLGPFSASSAGELPGQPSPIPQEVTDSVGSRVDALSERLSTPAPSPSLSPVHRLSSPSKGRAGGENLPTPEVSSLGSPPDHLSPKGFDVAVGNSALASPVTTIQQGQLRPHSMESSHTLPRAQSQHDLHTLTPTCSLWERRSTTQMLNNAQTCSTPPPARPGRLVTLRSAQTSPIWLCQSDDFSVVSRRQPSGLGLLRHSNSRTKSAELRDLNSSVTSSLLEQSASYGLSGDQFSLTAPNTFSEGCWLVDRSEGEAPVPVTCHQLPSKELLPAAADEEINVFEVNTSSLDSYDSCKFAGQQLSDGEFGERSGINPLRNPVLHVMAMQGGDRQVLSTMEHQRRTLSARARQRIKTLAERMESRQFKHSDANVSPGEQRMDGQSVQRPPDRSSQPSSSPSSTPQVNSQPSSLDWLKSLARGGAGSVQLSSVASRQNQAVAERKTLITTMEEQVRVSPGETQAEKQDERQNLLLPEVQMLTTGCSDDTTVDEGDAYDEDTFTIDLTDDETGGSSGKHPVEPALPNVQQ